MPFYTSSFSVLFSTSFFVCRFCLESSANFRAYAMNTPIRIFFFFFFVLSWLLNSVTHIFWIISNLVYFTRIQVIGQLPFLYKVSIRGFSSFRKLSLSADTLPRSFDIYIDFLKVAKWLKQKLLWHKCAAVD